MYPLTSRTDRIYPAEAISRHSGKLGTFAHGFTYAGHPVAAAVALETLRIYRERDIVALGRPNAMITDKKGVSVLPHSRRICDCASEVSIVSIWSSESFFDVVGVRHALRRTCAEE